jgi:RHS repeat-associated protein
MTMQPERRDGFLSARGFDRGACLRCCRFLGGGLVPDSFVGARHSVRANSTALLLVVAMTFSWTVSRSQTVGSSDASLGAAIAAIGNAVADGVSGAAHAAVSVSQFAANGAVSMAEASQTRRTRRGLTVVGAAALGLVVGERRTSAASSSSSDPNINPALVSTLAGSGTNATTDGSGSSASFQQMGGVVVVSGYAYVGTNGSIRKVNVSSGAVTTLAGDQTATGCTDSSTPGSVRFGTIVDEATDGTYLYATQSDCGTGSTYLIRKVTISTGATTTLTTAPSSFTYSGYVSYSGGFLFMSGSSLLKIDVSTVPDTSSVFATMPDKGHAIVGDGTILWVSVGSTTSAIEEVLLSTGAVSTFVSASDASLVSNSIEAAGSSLYVMADGAVLRRYTESTGSLVNIAGTDPAISLGDNVAEPAFADGTATDAWFSNSTAGIGSDGTNLYIADSGNFRLREASAGTAWSSGQPAEYNTTVSMATAQIKTLAGNGTYATTDGTGSGASFENPEGVAISGGYGYVGSQNAIRKVNLLTGAVTILAGNASATGCTDGADPTQVRFTGAQELVTDGHFLYEIANNCTSAGVIRRTSIATGATSTIAEPVRIANMTIGPDGALYYAPPIGTTISRVDPVTGAATTFATVASPIQSLTADSSYVWVSGATSSASEVDKVTVGGSVSVVRSTGSLELSLASLTSAGDFLYGFVPGSSSSKLDRISKADGSHVDVAGSPAGSFQDGVGLDAQMSGDPIGMASDGSSLWFADTTNNRFRKAARVTGELSDPSQCNCGRRPVGNPVDSGSGNFYESYTDLTIPGRSPALNETRTYGAFNASYNGPFGYGWSSTYDMHLQLGTLSGPSPVDVVEENDALDSFNWNGSQYVGPAHVFATLVHNGDGTYTFTRRSQEQFVFDANGLLIKEIARDGFAGTPGTGVPAAYTTTLTYSSGRLSTVTDAAGRTLTVSYGTNGKASGIADSTGRSVGYGYDSSGNLTDVTDVASGNTHYTYDTNHLLQTVRDPRGNTVETNVYDSSGRVLTQTDGLTRTTTFDYTSIPGSTKVTDPKGNVTVDAFENDLVMSETHGYGTASAATWNYTYEPTTLGVTTVTDPNLHSTNYTWDPSGNPLTKSDALTHTTTWTYNALGEPLTIQDPKLVTTTNTYGMAGNLTSTATPLVEQPGQTQTTTYTYGDTAHPGDVTSITDPRSKVSTFTYDASTGDVLSHTSPLGDKTTYTYDSAGRRLTMVTPSGNVTGGNPAAYTTTYVPNAFGQVTSITDPLGHQTQYVYDADRNLHQVIDPLTQTTTYDYDVANQQITISRPDTTVLHNDYLPDGTLKTQTDGAGNVTSYAYDPLGRLSSTTDPKSRVTNYTHDGVGNLTTSQDPALRTTTYGYDIADRLTSVSYSDGTTPNVAYTYDNDNQRLTMVDGTGTTTSVWDSLHRLTSQTNGAGQVMGYGYDLASNLTMITYPGSHTVTRVYDDSGRLHTITDWLTHTTTYDYDHNSNLTTQTYPNTTVATDTPDAADRLMNISDAKSGTPFASFGYTRNNADLLTGVTPTGVGQSNETYGYSSLNQLNAVNGSSYTFDAADNLTGMPSGTKLAYDTANQLCWTAPTTAACASPPSGATTYTSGSGGERTAMTPPTGNPTINYAYDQEYRLTDVRGAGYRTAVLASNPLGYWRLGEASGTTAADSSGNAHTGTTTAITWGAASATATDANTAATFNGTTSYVNAGSLTAGQSSTFSAEAWIKGSATTGRYFVTEGSTSTNTPYWGLATDATTGTKALFTVRDNAGVTATVNGTKTVMDGAWHHVVGVRNGSTFSLYVDGAADGTTTTTLGSITLNATVVGALKRTTVSNFFNGSIDEGAIYPTALAASRIVNHYQAAKSNYAGAATANAPSGYWRLGETSGTSAADTSGNAHTGTYTGGYTLSATGALTSDTDKAVTFNGTTGYVNAVSVGAGQSSTFSAEAWIKTTQSSGTPPYFVGEGSTSSNNPFDGLTLSTALTKAEFHVRDNAGNQVILDGTTTVNNGAWHHLVGVRNGNSFSLYVDGNLDATTTSSSLGTITLNTTTVGALKRPAVGNFTNGTIDEAALYPTSLDAATVGRHYYNGTNSRPTAASYTYDGDGTRTAKTVDGIKTALTWDAAEGLPLLGSDGTNQYIYGPSGAPLEHVNTSTSATIYYHQDQQASTRALTDQNGNLTATYTTDAYGNPTSSTGTTLTSLRYNGEYRDNESGLVYLRARYYDPTTAQFLTRDPAVAVTRSAYGYALDNPTNSVDPTGMFVDPPVIPPIVVAGGELTLIDVVAPVAVGVALGYGIYRIDPLNGPLESFGGAIYDFFSSGDRDPTRLECNLAEKLLNQYRRLAQKFGIQLSPERLAQLDALRDSGNIRQSDLPGRLRREFPGVFGDHTLGEIREMCRKASRKWRRSG